MNLSQTDLTILKKYLTGGAALGTAAAGGTALLNHLNQLSKERTRQQKLDDDVLTVKIRRPRGVKQAMVTGGVGLAGGALSLLGSYALTQKMYKAMKKKRQQELLDRAQIQFADLSASEDEVSKQAGAGRPMGGWDLLASSPIAAMLILGLGSAGVTNAYLKKNYPGVTAARPTKPRKVVLQYVDEEDGKTKKASADLDSGFELVVKTILAGQKQASDLSDLVCACADGRVKELEEAVTDLGAETALDLVKGASRDLSDAEMVMGTALAVRAPGISDLTKTLACAEYHDLFPAFSKMAAALSTEDLDMVQALACVWDDLNRWPQTKSAAQTIDQNPDLSEELARVLTEQGQLDSLDEEQELALDTMGQAGATVNGVDRSDEEDPDQVAESMGEAAATDDIVDQILGGMVGDEGGKSPKV